MANCNCTVFLIYLLSSSVLTLFPPSIAPLSVRNKNVSDFLTFFLPIHSNMILVHAGLIEYVTTRRKNGFLLLVVTVGGAKIAAVVAGAAEVEGVCAVVVAVEVGAAVVLD